MDSDRCVSMPLSLRARATRLVGLTVVVAGALGLLSVVGVFGSQGGGPGIENARIIAPPVDSALAELSISAEPGALAPDFEVSDIDGSRHRLSDYRGKVVYLNFWATWCVPCQAEMPDIHRLMSEHEADLAVIVVNRGESLSRTQNFLGELPRLDGGTGVSFTVNGMDPDDTLYDKYRGLGMPLSVFIDKTGVVTRIANGQISFEQMEEAFAQAETSEPNQ